MVSGKGLGGGLANTRRPTCAGATLSLLSRRTVLWRRIRTGIGRRVLPRASGLDVSCVQRPAFHGVRGWSEPHVRNRKPIVRRLSRSWRRPVVGSGLPGIRPKTQWIGPVFSSHHSRRDRRTVPSRPDVCEASAKPDDFAPTVRPGAEQALSSGPVLHPVRVYKATGWGE